MFCFFFFLNYVLYPYQEGKGLLRIIVHYLLLVSSKDSSFANRLGLGTGSRQGVWVLTAKRTHQADSQTTGQLSWTWNYSLVPNAIFAFVRKLSMLWT